VRASNPDGSGTAVSSAMMLWRTPSTANSTATNNPQRIVPRHLGKAMCVFVDGHAKALQPSGVGFQYPRGDALALWDLF
jgi:prepilin-type processing-associated H-X9-DG protein